MKHGVDRQNSSTGATYARDEESEKRKKDEEINLSGKLGIRRYLSYLWLWL